ncbi:uncharacterized protein LOC134708331 [Mytilus trossulus]|uniref:uncharacterized protein LOC134708331 n=1 Tax=Mytilus trossulus TaxID=6551 RepID=UPI0030075B70
MDDFLSFTILDESDSEDILYCKNCGELLEEQSDMVSHDCPKLSAEHKKDLKMTLTLDKLNHKDKTQNKSSSNKRKHSDVLDQELTEQVFLIKEDSLIKNNYNVKKTQNEKDAKRTKLDMHEDKQSSQSENRKKWTNKTAMKIESQKKLKNNKSSKVKIQRLDVNLNRKDDPLSTKLDSYISPKGVLKGGGKVNGESVEMQEKIQPALNRIGTEMNNKEKQELSKIKQNSRKTGSHKHKIMPSVRAEIKGTANSDNVNIRIEKFQSNEQVSPKMRIEREQSEKDITSTKVTPKSTDSTQTLNCAEVDSFSDVDNTNIQDDEVLHQTLKGEITQATLEGEITQASYSHIGKEIEDKLSEKGGGTKKPMFMTLCDSCGFFVPTEHECAVQNNSNLELFTSVLSTESEDRIPKGTDFVIVEKGASNPDLSVQNFHQINGYLKSGKDSTLEDYNCIQCGESFVSNNIQIKSEEQIFSIGSDLVTFFRCEKCTILLSVKDKIKEGFVTCMNVDDFTPLIDRKKNKVVCRICGEDLNDLEKIKWLSHFVSHAKQIKKQCIICLQPIFTLRKTRTHMRKHKILIETTNFFRQVKPELSGCHKKSDKMNSVAYEENVDKVQSSEGSAGNLDHIPTALTNCNQTDKETPTLYDKDGNMFRVDLAKNTLICNFAKEDKNKNKTMSHDTMRKSVGISSSRNENSERSQSVYTYKVDGNNVVPTSETGVPDNRWRGNDRNKLTNSLDKYNLRKGKKKVDYAELDKGLAPESQYTVAPSHVRLSSGYRVHNSNFNGVVPARYQSNLNRQSMAASAFNTTAPSVNRQSMAVSSFNTTMASANTTHLDNRRMTIMVSANTTPIVQSNTNVIRNNQNYANSLLSSQAYIGDLIQTLDTCPSTEISDQFLQLADGHPVVSTPSSQLNEISSSKNMFDDILTSAGTVRTYPCYHSNNQRPISHGLQEVQTPIDHSNSHLSSGNVSQISVNASHLQSKSYIHVPQASVVRLIDNSGQVSQTIQGKMSNTSMIDLNNTSVPVSATSYPNDLLGQLVQSSGITEGLQDGDIFSNYVQNNISISSRDIPTSLMSTTHAPQVSQTSVLPNHAPQASQTSVLPNHAPQVTQTSVLPNHVSKTLSLSQSLSLPQQASQTSSLLEPLALPPQVAQTSSLSQSLSLPQQVAQTSSVSQPLSLPQQMAQTSSVSQPLSLAQQMAQTSELINVSVSLPYSSSVSLTQSNMTNITTHEPQTNTGGVSNSLDENFNRIQMLYMQEMPEGMTEEEEIKFLSQMNSDGATPFQIKESSESDNESTSDSVNNYNHSQNGDENVENCNKVQNKKNANFESLNIGIVQNFDEGNPMYVQEEVEVESTCSKGIPRTWARKKISPKTSQDFKCKLCALTFRRKDLLSKHEELHVTNPHTCWQCCLTFNSAVQYSNHIKEEKYNH